MAYEVRIADEGPVYGGADAVACRFGDEAWWNLLALAHGCGFDPDEEYVRAVLPTEEDEARELDARTATGLYIGVGAILNQDTLPFATTWESDDGMLRFRWASSPDYAHDQQPEGTPDAAGLPDFALDKADLQRLLECLRDARVLVARA